MIYHLSYPQWNRINDHIAKDPYSLSYVRVDDAIHILQSLGKGAFMAMTDLKSAFCLIPIHPKDWNLLGILWNSQYYVDMYLPFGLCSAPFIFNQLSDGLEWILKLNYGLQQVIHILDNFFIAESSRLACLTSFSTLLRVFLSLKVPVVASKTIGPSQEIEFMGIVLDNIHTEALLPRTNFPGLMTCWPPLRNAAPCTWLSYNHLLVLSSLHVKWIVPSRTFLQRAINLTKGVSLVVFITSGLTKSSLRTSIWGKFSSSNGTSAPFFLSLALPLLQT